MIDEPPTPAAPIAPISSAKAPPGGTGRRQDLVRWGVWLIAIGVLLSIARLAIGIFLSYFYAPTVSSNLPEYAFASLSAAAGAIVGLGVFLAALGLARGTPGGNPRWVIGGLLMFVGLLAESSTQLIVYAAFYGGNTLGGDVFLAINLITFSLSLLLPVGLAVFFFGFLRPEHTGSVP